MSTHHPSHFSSAQCKCYSFTAITVDRCMRNQCIWNLEDVVTNRHQPAKGLHVAIYTSQKLSSIYIWLKIRNQQRAYERLKAVLLHDPPMEVPKEENIVQWVSVYSDLQDESNRSNIPKVEMYSHRVKRLPTVCIDGDNCYCLTFILFLKP